MNGLVCKNLSAGYGSRTVLKDISGEFLAGAVTFVLGPNGSGKSTLLRALGGGIPFKGAARVGGADVASLSPMRRGRMIGVVTQSPSLNFPFTVEDVIAMGRLPHRRFLQRTGGRDSETVREAAAEMELEDLLTRRLSSLSGGERQRTVIAQTIAQEPDIFLLDEPSSALDPRHTLRLFRFLQRIAGEGKTVAAAVHDINLAAEFGDFVWMLKDGRLVAAGTVEETLTGETLSSVYDVPFSPLRGDFGHRSVDGPSGPDGKERILWRAV